MSAWLKVVRSAGGILGFDEALGDSAPDRGHRDDLFFAAGGAAGMTGGAWHRVRVPEVWDARPAPLRCAALSRRKRAWAWHSAVGLHVADDVADGSFLSFVLQHRRNGNRPWERAIRHWLFPFR